MKKIVLNEEKLHHIISHAVCNILSEGLFEKRADNDDFDEDDDNDWYEEDDEDEDDEYEDTEDDEDDEKFVFGKKSGEHEEDEDVVSKAIEALKDDKIDMAEIVRQLEDMGFLSGDEDTDRSWLSKIVRGERPMPPGIAAAVMNILGDEE